MARAAAPIYLASADTNDASPEMRFGLLLPIWRAQWKKDTDELRGAWHRVTKLTPQDIDRMQNLVSRQQAMMATLDKDAIFAVDANAIAPFTTGLGNEHPLENGFSFLNPYGLPYLPGSGVKGAVRRAAEELASGEWGESDWSSEKAYSITIDDEAIPLSTFEVLFGREALKGEQKQVRGALSFWDVIPQIKDDHLMVEIMTPHQGHYYKDGDSPHDSGQPNPISFLTVPPESAFAFHMTCDLQHCRRVATDLVVQGRWKTLLEAAFVHAFDWCGFGAKTAVGYGAMERDYEGEQLRAQEAEKSAREELEKSRLAALSPLELDIEAITQRHKDNPGAGLYHEFNKNKWELSEDKKAVAEKIKEYWRNDSKWYPDFSGTNRKKLQQRERCREVQNWIDNG